MKNYRLLVAAGAAALLTACGGGDPVAPAATVEERDGWTLTPAGDLNSFFDCLDEAGQTLISAHRGGPKNGLPENALETLQATLTDVPAIMEIDVAQSADGVLFLMHDDRLERTTTGAGFAEKKLWREISALRLKDDDGRVTDYAPPEFSDVLAWAKSRTILQIDFKRSAEYEKVVDEIYRQSAEDQVVLIAYSMASAQKLHSLAPDMMISLSVASQSDLNRAVASGVPENRLMAFTGTESPAPRLLALLDQRGIEGIFGTLGGAASIDADIARSGDDARYGEIADAGVDILATDRPRAAYAALSSAGESPTAGVCGVAKG